MSSVVNPVGPEPPSVYWRRRLLVGLGALVVLIVLFMLLKSCAGGEPTATGGTTSPSPSPSATNSSSPSPSSTNTADAVDCTTSDIEVTTQPDKTSVPVGTPITFQLHVKNISSKACKRNVGPKVNTITVTSGGVHVWSSDDCASPNQGDDIKVIQPGETYAVQATWEQQLTESGCPSGLGNAKAGSYEVVSTNDGDNSEPVAITIT